jgi:voltage-gated potassium channel Kch
VALSLGSLCGAFLDVARSPRTRALPWLAVAVVAIGTVFYSVVEGWTVITALYFSVVTLTTVGYGDISPSTDPARLFTVFYILIGVGILLALITAVIQSYIRAER